MRWRISRYPAVDVATEMALSTVPGADNQLWFRLAGRPHWRQGLLLLPRAQDRCRRALLVGDNEFLRRAQVHARRPPNTDLRLCVHHVVSHLSKSFTLLPWCKLRAAAAIRSTYASMQCRFDPTASRRAMQSTESPLRPRP